MQLILRGTVAHASGREQGFTCSTVLEDYILHMYCRDVLVLLRKECHALGHTQVIRKQSSLTLPKLLASSNLQLYDPSPSILRRFHPLTLPSCIGNL